MTSAWLRGLAPGVLLSAWVASALPAQQPDSTRVDSTRADTMRVDTATVRPDTTAGRQDTTTAHQDTTTAPAPVAPVRELAPIEVVGTIRPSAGPTIGSGVPARVTILSGKQVDAYEPRILSDVLRQQAGISIYDDVGSPYKLNVSTRGFFASPVVGLPQGVSVFLDGVRQNEPDAAEVNFDLLPMQYVKRIELLSGTASLQGRNSLGGAINLVTARGNGPLGGELELQGGSFGTVNGNGSVSGLTPGGIDYYVGAGYNREDGWRQATGAHQYNGFFNLGKLTDTWGLSLQGFGAKSRAETAGSLPASLFDVRPDSNFTIGDFENLSLVQLAASGYRQLGTGRGSFRAYFRRSTAERFNVNQPDDPDAFGTSRNLTFGWGLDYRWAHGIGNAVLGVRVGTDGSVNSSRIALFADSSKFGGVRGQTTLVDSPLSDGALFVTSDLTLGRLTFSAGARADYVHIPFHNLLDPGADTTSSYFRVNPKGGVSVDLGGGLSAYGSVGQSYRTPALIELACADPDRPCVLPFALGDDPPIEPVVATTYELGGTWAVGPSVFTASAYRSDVKNDIYLFPSENEVSGSTIEGHFDNLPETRREGVELGATVTLHRDYSVYANYAWTRATFRAAADISSPREDATGQPNLVQPGDEIPLVPEHQVKFGASARLPAGIDVAADARWIGDQWLRGDEANLDMPLGSYFVTDARVTWQVGPWEFSGLVTNLFNRHYANFGTFNVNQLNSAGPTFERFLTPGQERAVRLVVRRSFGGRSAAQGGGTDLD
ncbi:MAG TPA: TonB-dependent receptor [Gemmatimonadales bacterium]|nr:TonB-dependent receptor [Gemmatimonadales bacterium]